MLTLDAELRLRPLRVSDEDAYRRAEEEMRANDNFRFGFIAKGESFADHITRMEATRRGREAEGMVEGTFLVADVDGSLVGRTSVRHVLNSQLAFHGGHIGYAVRPKFRRRGYGGEILRQSLVVVRSYGVERVLLTCDADNLTSFQIIEAAGGELERVVTAASSDTGNAFRRYWIS